MDQPEIAQATPRRRREAFVVVHGVGAVAAGDMLRQLVGEMAGPLDEHRVGAETYPRSRDDKPDGPDGYEVFWANLKPGGDKAGEKRLRLFHVFLALSRIGGTGWRGPAMGVNEHSVFGSAVHWMLWSLVLSLPALVFSSLHVHALGLPWGALAVLATVLPAVLLAWSLRRLDRAAAAPLVLAPLLGLGVILAQMSGRLGSDGGAPMAAKALLWGYWLFIGLSTAAVAEIGWKSLRAARKGNPPPMLAALVRFAALTLPFTILAGALGAITWAIHLFYYRKGTNDGFQQWATAYQRALSYDLALAEFAYWAATFGLGLFFAVGFLRFLLTLKSKAAAARGTSSGQGVRDWIGRTLMFLLVASVAVAFFFCLNSIWLPGEKILEVLPGLKTFRDGLIYWTGRVLGMNAEHARAATGATSALGVFVVYAASSTRLTSFAFGLIKPVRLAANIMADVVLYIAPDGPLSYGASARARVSALVNDLGQRFETVVLVGYSQGSVIAADALADVHVPVRLVTAGSPIDSLYRRFLAVAPRADVQAKTLSWTNFYRPSDYIGGPVEDAENQVVAGGYPLNHLDYFHEPELVKALPRR